MSVEGVRKGTFSVTMVYKRVRVGLRGGASPYKIPLSTPPPPTSPPPSCYIAITLKCLWAQLDSLDSISRSSLLVYHIPTWSVVN